MSLSEKTKNFYNTVAKQSFNDWFNNPALLLTLTIFIQHLPDNPLVLDLGCGTGGESKRLSELGAHVTGIDFSEESLEYAKRNVPEVEFKLVDILQMNFQEEYFDGIMEAGVLFHFNKREQEIILKKIVSSTKAKGIFLSYYPEGDFEGMQDIEVSGEMFKRYIRLLPIEKWISQIMNNGFTRFIKHDFNVGSFKCVEFFK
jgi:2-polyprenyl-3-methyl-5-hydroxy-6-metoxy-1,4-benzoquinol methylase